MLYINDFFFPEQQPRTILSIKCLAVFLSYGVVPGGCFFHIYSTETMQDQQGFDHVCGQEKRHEDSFIPKHQHAGVIRFSARFEVLGDFIAIQIGLH